ncbi:MAG TPA: SufE family protein [Bacteriovoracaceae bacterium]|nr:SufE family protein [Bacteriovoracaceae bacterium]
MLERTNQIKDRFLKFSDWEDRYKELIHLGRTLDAYPEDKREEKYKVKGCQSQVWLYPEFKDGRVYFHGDSDAMLVKGIVGLLVNVYSDATPDEILNTKPEFLKEVGITEHLSMNRSSGLASMMKQIQMYALVYKSMQKVQ